MYRIFCESYKNFLETFEEDSYRVNITKPFKLIVDIDKYEEEKEKNSQFYKELSDLIYFMKQKVEEFPKLKAFLWTLDARNIKAKKYNVVKKSDLEEQTKLINSFLKLAYWY